MCYAIDTNMGQVCVQMQDDPFGSIINWILYSRISYWGSHWSANVLIAIPVILIVFKIMQGRFHDYGLGIKFLSFLALDIFMVGTFVPSLHEAIFEPVFVGVRLLQNPSTLILYVNEWNQNIEVWRSFCILFGWTTVLGFAFYWHRMKFRFRDWEPFIFSFMFWIIVFGLPVSLPFPVSEIGGVLTYCHDCFIPNFFEFLFNLTFAVGIVRCFDAFPAVHYHIKKRRPMEPKDIKPVSL